jgi:hypothetical protein
MATMTTTTTIELTSLDNKYEVSSKEPSFPAIGSGVGEEAVNASINLSRVGIMKSQQEQLQ